MLGRSALFASFGYGAVAAYTAAMALVTVILVVLASETLREKINETQAAERRLITEGPEPGAR